MPAAGHWQKIKFEKEVLRPRLREKFTGKDVVTLAVRDNTDGNVPKTSSRVRLIQLEIEKDNRLILQVSERLVQPHPLVTVAKKYLSQRDTDNWQYRGTVSCSREYLDIRVTPKNVSTTLRILDTLFKALETRGHYIRIRNGSTYVVMGEEEFRVCMRKKMKKVIENDGSWNRQVFHPTGILAFQMNPSYGKEWKDGKDPLENHLSSIDAHLDLAALEWMERRIQWKKKEDEEKEKDRLRRVLEERREKEVNDFKGLLLKAEHWQKADNLRRYITEVRRRNSPMSSELAEWVD